MANPRTGLITHKMVICEYTLKLLNTKTHNLEEQHITRKGLWTFEKVWDLEYRSTSRKPGSSHMFVGIEDYTERKFIVGMEPDDYFEKAFVIKEVK